MHILELPDDLLLNVGSLLLPLLFEPRYAFTYCTDYLERRPVFRKLVRVCRRFYGLFTPSLYRTLHLIYEECNYSEESRERWYGLNAQRRTTRALLRTLESELPHRTYVHNLELVWDVSRDEGYYDRLDSFIAKFPKVRDLDVEIVTEKAQPLQWDLNFIFENPLQHLRKIRLANAIAAEMLPMIIFLPSIDDINLLLNDPEDLQEWILPLNAIPGQSPVTTLYIRATLSATQMLCLLSWPKKLQSFSYDHGAPFDQLWDGPMHDQTPPPSVDTFNQGLAPFRETLKSLSLQLSDRHLESCNTYPTLSISEFPNLQHLNAPSYILLGLPYAGKNYNRTTLSSKLPTSLTSLALTFGTKDNLFPSNFSWFDLPNNTHARTTCSWISQILEENVPWGPLPNLRILKLSDYKSTNHTSQSTLRYKFPILFQKPDLEVLVSRGWNHIDRDNNYYDEGYGYEPDWWRHMGMFCAEDDGPFSQLFDEEEIERRETYSDTDGSNVDEDAYDDLFDDEEFWERFDKRMSKEYEKEKARKWPTAAGYPDYVDSIEERKAVFSLTSVDFDVPYDASVPGSNGERYLGNREVYSMR